MRNFQGIAFIWTKANREIFKSAFVYLMQIWKLVYIKELAESRSLIEKPLYSGHFFFSTAWTFRQIYLLITDTLWLAGEKKSHACFYSTNFFTLTWSSLSNFSKLFSTHVITLTSQKKIFDRYSSSNLTPRPTLFPVTSIRI